jgi:hypothetical protein
MTLIIHTPYTAQYTDPIRFAAGEPVRLTGKEDAWEGRADWLWLWAVDATGREGWISADFVDRTVTPPVARADYVAAELTVASGDRLEALAFSCGWYWTRTPAGGLGWVPASHVILA